MKKIKKCDVAGQFYPSDPHELTKMLDQFCLEAPSFDLNAKAIIAPHAGYIFSGPIASTAYKLIESKKTETVFLLSPSHNYGFQGMALTDASEFETPLGNIKVNNELNKKVLQCPSTSLLPQPFSPEHSLETHLPFIKKYLPKASLVPIICGRVSPQDIATVLNVTQEAMIIISSDLSHFMTYEDCNLTDQKTSTLIQSMDYSKLHGELACGYTPISGLCLWAKEKGFSIKELHLQNSGDIQGGKEQVVGYGAFAVY